ncbi:MAG TPA: Rap1a/Tai family immunity protein [Geminicoccaceae bacterium]|nr:Rap1a/Tai family immunity protein [Geminicoccus sp.]HMU51133.1 Rap1a/Tai family immunity protein [Geminicoccaceae bacterium]
MRGALIGFAMAGLLAAAPSGSPLAAEADAFKLRNFGDLVALCADNGDIEAVQLCRGYILGAGSLYMELVRAKRITAWACADPVPTVDEARAEIVGWARANPATHSEQPIDGLWRAAAAVWPCPRG